MTMPSKAKIFKHWMNWLDLNGFDWGEPCCWSCRKSCGSEYDSKNPRASLKEIINNWNIAPLQRCHIIAKQFGGEDEPHNLFLMCSECHDRAPNTKSREAFLLWISKQDYSAHLAECIKKELITFEIQDKTKIMNELIGSENLIHALSHDIGVHVNQKSGGTEITVSSIIAAISTYIKEREHYNNKMH